ncbi:hypothetical protein TRFO_23592 [Tritrichomonas foetus]|uniref:Protein kinase domain-containing protein n=1 Tax=Tritrichomonas foetus TaxID=1144522 RepID=A0A1J4KEM9_9EUKA|nr:hypothetical protein TRFO_23592 [Tritrichomonas foetus]|eukprot:OHT08054.1 hypothetical protein TRFO_23592 [Tritrichomonas foetus]
MLVTNVSENFQLMGKYAGRNELQLDIPQQMISIGGNHAIYIDEKYHAYIIGDDVISSKTTRHQTWVKLNLPTNDCYQYVYCGNEYYLLITTACELIYCHRNCESDEPYQVELSETPIKVTGSYVRPAILDSKGDLHLFSSKDPYQTPELVHLPERIVTVADGVQFTIVATIKGETYARGVLCDYPDMKQFSLVNSLSKYKIVKLHAMHSHCLALSDKGIAFSAGWNLFGQLGVGNSIDNKNFQKVMINTKIKDIRSGYLHSVFLDYDNNIYVCGSNYYGQLLLPDNIEGNNKILTPLCVDKYIGRVTSIDVGSTSTILHLTEEMLTTESNNNTSSNNINHTSFASSKKIPHYDSDSIFIDSKEKQIEKTVEKNEISDKSNGYSRIMKLQEENKSLKSIVIRLIRYHISNEAHNLCHNQPNFIQYQDLKAYTTIKRLRYYSSNIILNVKIAKKEDKKYFITKYDRNLEINKFSNNPYILGVYGISQKTNDQETKCSKYCIITEISGKSLYQIMENGKRNKDEIACMEKNIVYALFALILYNQFPHFIHIDNIRFLDKYYPQFVNLYENIEPHHASNEIKEFIAPEIFDYNEYDPCKSIIYSFGVILAFIETGKIIRRNCITNEQLIPKVKNDPEMENLIKSCLSHDPDSRPTIDKLLELIDNRK